MGIDSMQKDRGSRLGSDERILEPTGREMRRLVDAAMERIVDHIESLPAQPSADHDGAIDLARSLRESLPEQGVPFDEILHLFFERAVPKSYNTAGPGYLAYIPGGGLFHTAVADLMADAVNRYVGVWIAAPGLVELEANAVRWLCEIVDYPPQASGFLTSGGSLANFSAVVVARRELLPDDFLRGTLYVSEQVHHSVLKAAILAGFPEKNVRVVRTDDRFSIDIAALRTRVAEDRQAGWQPFMIIGSAGTTNTGAVDDLETLADLAARERLWFHADAAYGGFFMLTDRGRRLMRGLDRADSITLDPHKGMFLPYGTGSLLVRDGPTLRRAHAVREGADYLPAMQDAAEFVDFCEISPELSRPFRGVRVWLPIKLLGAGPFRQALDEKLDLAQWAAEQLRRISVIEIVAEPQLSVVAFRLRASGEGLEEVNELNREFLRRINERGRVYLTGTILDGRFTLRICVLSFRTHLDRLEEGLEDIRQAAAELA
jgi:aromatic-L-amino-acid decarboxylase